MGNDPARAARCRGRTPVYPRSLAFAILPCPSPVLAPSPAVPPALPAALPAALPSPPPAFAVFAAVFAAVNKQRSSAAWERRPAAQLSGVIPVRGWGWSTGAP